MMRPSITLRPLIFILFFGLSACTGNKKIPNDTLIVALGSAPTTLDPRFATDANGMRIGGLIFSSLIRRGEGFKPEAEAAEKWTFKNRVFSFVMRKDLKFHNGRPVTAEDLMFSFEQFRGASSPFASALALITDVKVEGKDDALVVHVHLKNYSDKFLISDLPAVRILPKAETLAAGADFSKVLLGTGGYKFIKQDSSHVQLESVTAKTKNLIFKIIRDDFTRFQKMIKGEVDIVQADMPVDKMGEFEKKQDRFQVFRYPGLAMTYILLNLKDPLLKSKEVRLALAQTLQRQDIIDHKLHGLATEATSLLTPNNPYFRVDLKNPEFNLEAAKAKIEQMEHVGKTLTLKTSNSPQAIDNGKILSRQMSASGLKIEMQSFEWATFYDDVKKGNFQMATMRWVGTVDPDLYRVAFHSRELPPGRNRGAYINSKLDRLLDLSASAEDPRMRKKIVYEVQKIVHDDLAVIPLWYDHQVAVAQKNILHYQPVQSGEFYPLLAVRKSEP